MWMIGKEFYFAAAHHLPQLPDGHKCRNVHGHNYRVTLVLASRELDKDGFVADYGDLSSFKQFIDATLDHRDLNEALPFWPTAEELARWIYEHCIETYPWSQFLTTVVVQETDKTMAAYAPGQVTPWTP